MEYVGLYRQITEFTNENAGTAEWCIAKKNGKEYFVKKFQKPVYPSQALGLTSEKYQARVDRFHKEEAHYNALYEALRDHNDSGTMIIPEEVVSYQFHICTIADCFRENLKAATVYKLSPWQRLVLMRTLTLALMGVHDAGIVHGDMKPDNLLISQNPDTGTCVLRLIDFDGSYFAKEPPEHFDDIRGDMAFWAPEIYAKYDHDEIVLTPHVDDFALGLILHFFWSGTLPDKPKDQTVGQYVYSGGKVRIDETRFPLALAKTIEGLLNVDPLQRISCKQVYTVLGVQLEQYPKEIVKLVDPPKPEKKKPERVTPPTETEKGGEIRIICVDTKDNTLKTECRACSGITAMEIHAPDIEGYKRIGLAKSIVHINDKGVPDQPVVRFLYKKRNRLAIWFGLGILLVFFLTSIVGGIGYSQAESAGDWETAYRYSKWIPGFKVFFDESYTETCYRYGITMYHRKCYDEAYRVFQELFNTYGDVYKYRQLCNAHLNGTQGMYDTLLSYVGFEDAEALFLQNDSFVF